MHNPVRIAASVLALLSFAIGCGGSDGSPPVLSDGGSGSGSQDGAMNDGATTTPGTDGAATTDGGTTSLDGATGDTLPSAQLDPAPGFTTPGFFAPNPGPTTNVTTFDLLLGQETSRQFSGTITGAQGDGLFYVVKTKNVDGTDPLGISELAGPIPTNLSGGFNFTAPLFCGTQIVKCVWNSAQGRAVLVTRVITTNCVEPDIRITISWDDKGDDWELHLIKPGGTINNNATDCTWTSCLGAASPDWGVTGDPSDNPKKDVDNTGTFGPENIFLAKPETGRFHVLVEHWGPGLPSAGQVVINVRGRVTIVNITNFITQHVRTVATIDWPSQTVSVINSDYNCSANWSSGCRDMLPMSAAF